MAVDKLEIETYFGKCKCCLSYGYLRTMWEEHVVENEAEIYGQMLTQCFSLSWTIQDKEEDDQICEDCIWKLREAYKFKNQVIRCQTQLGQFTEGDIIENVIEIKEEDPELENFVVEYLDEDILDKQNLNDDNSDDDSQRHNYDDDDVASLKDVDYDENQDPEDEVSDDEDSSNDTPAPRKRKPATKDKTDSETDAPKPKWPKKLPREERWKTYKQYADDDLKHAIDAVMAKRMNQKAAAKYYRVPRKTLSVKVLAIKNNQNERPLTPKSEDDDPLNTQDTENAMLIIKKHRENIHSVLAYSNATPIRGYWGEGYVCAFCPKQFTKAAALKTHCLSHGDISEIYTVQHVRTHIARLDVTGLKCLICNTKIEDLMSLMNHLSNHDKPMHFDINNHMVPFRFDTKELKCIECGKVFKLFKNLSEHMANMHYRNYVCRRCNRGFVSKVNLVAHKETHQRGSFPCNYCGKIYNTRRKKTSHERMTHTLQTKTVKCEYCNKRFENASQKNNHELRTHMKQKIQFKCNSCNKSYLQSRLLRYHIQKEHLLYRPYKCPQDGCEKAFYLNKTLQAHILTHDDGKPFSCSMCPKAYRSEKALKKHMYLHNDKKEFKCDMCSRSYVLEENLRRHLKDKH